MQVFGCWLELHKKTYDQLVTNKFFYQNDFVFFEVIWYVFISIEELDAKKKNYYWFSLQVECL